MNELEKITKLYKKINKIDNAELFIVLCLKELYDNEVDEEIKEITQAQLDSIKSACDHFFENSNIIGILDRDIINKLHRK